MAGDSEQRTPALADTPDRIDDDFDAYLIGDDWDDNNAEPVEPPQDADRANKLLRVHHWLVAEQARYHAKADAEIATIQRWLEDRTAGLARRQQQIEHVLEQWTRAVHPDPTKGVTEHLPAGALRLRAPRFHILVTDEDKLCAWLEENGHADLLNKTVKPKEGAVKTAFKEGPVVSETDEVRWHALVTPEGEQVPGVRITKATTFPFDIT